MKSDIKRMYRRGIFLLPKQRKCFRDVSGHRWLDVNRLSILQDYPECIVKEEYDTDCFSISQGRIPVM